MPSNLMTVDSSVEDDSGRGERAWSEHSLSMVTIANGTHSKEVVGPIREEFPTLGILVVDEHDTSLKARGRHWEHNPRRGWRKLVPATLQTPPDPVDVFVAVILAERVLGE